MASSNPFGGDALVDVPTTTSGGDVEKPQDLMSVKFATFSRDGKLIDPVSRPVIPSGNDENDDDKDDKDKKDDTARGSGDGDGDDDQPSEGDEGGDQHETAEEEEATDDEIVEATPVDVKDTEVTKETVNPYLDEKEYDLDRLMSDHAYHKQMVVENQLKVKQIETALMTHHPTCDVARELHVKQERNETAKTRRENVRQALDQSVSLILRNADGDTATINDAKLTMKVGGLENKASSVIGSRKGHFYLSTSAGATLDNVQKTLLSYGIKANDILDVHVRGGGGGKRASSGNVKMSYEDRVKALTDGLDLSALRIQGSNIPAVRAVWGIIENAKRDVETTPNVVVSNALNAFDIATLKRIQSQCFVANLDTKLAGLTRAFFGDNWKS